MPVYSFPTNIAIGDLGQVTWANSVGAALNVLGPLVDTKANDVDVVKLTGNQTVAGVKTFSSAPSVPDNSFLISKVANLQLALDARALTSRLVAGKPLTADVVLAKADVGLANVDNTSDVNKPVSTAQQTALNLKVDKTTTVAGKALSANVSLVKADVGLGSVDNTSDAAKPISTLTQAALDLKLDATYERRGTGFPESVVTAPVGTFYTDTSATNGAVRWFKATGTGNTGWKLIDGDTGWRSVAVTAVTDGVQSGNILFRRVGSQVYCKLQNVVMATTVTGRCVLSPTIPTGFGQGTPNSTADRTMFIVGMNNNAVNGQLISVYAPEIDWISTLAGSATRPSGAGLQGEMMWSSVDPWPTTLPGVAAT